MTMDSHTTVFLTPSDAKALEFAMRHMLQWRDDLIIQRLIGEAGLTYEQLQTAYATLRAQTALPEKLSSRRDRDFDSLVRRAIEESNE